MSRDLDAAIEETLRALPAGSSLTTGRLIERTQLEGVGAGARYRRILAIAPRCPAAKKDMDNGFIRFGRTCYPWRWSRLEPDQPLVSAPETDAKAEGRNAFAAQVAAEVVDKLVALGYLPVKLEPISRRCASCGKAVAVEGFCPECIGDAT